MATKKEDEINHCKRCGKHANIGSIICRVCFLDKNRKESITSISHYFKGNPDNTYKQFLNDLHHLKITATKPRVAERAYYEPYVGWLPMKK